MSQHQPDPGSVTLEVPASHQALGQKLKNSYSEYLSIYVSEYLWACWDSSRELFSVVLGKLSLWLNRKKELYICYVPHFST